MRYAASMTVILVLLFVVVAPSSARKWTDSTGKFSTEAELTEIQGNTVILENTDGRRIAVPIARLSEADRQYLRSMGKSASEPPAQPETPDGSKPNLEEESPLEITNSIGMKLKRIPAGEFRMGTDGTGLPNEKPRRRMRILGSFYMGKHEVTQEQFQHVMDTNPSRYAQSGESSDRVDGLDTNPHPVDNTTWDDALAFCLALSQLPEEAGRQYRLPTSAEWEYACLAGAEGGFCFGDDESQLGRYARYEDNSQRHPWPVGSRRPNAFGVFDMHGNVQEWCTTRRDLYKTSDVAHDPTDPFGSIPQAKLKVRRGGRSGHKADACRSSVHVNYALSMEITSGFRVVMVEIANKP
ncbi:MAG: SUMF1/EgtB/PvdO family nonheme iron enzyme [Planctomycetes bacterium]|nr:SUMF1/EgtB/PvdO family nonheme iron enzyme [Planctomycetota bacterium]MBL7037530.1 SUMF1/EgtB/PvdO family nonheme iron enzyme [Pirellulaceae bacterium]